MPHSPKLSYEVYNVEHDGARRVFVMPLGADVGPMREGHPHDQDYRNLTDAQAMLLVSALLSYLPNSKGFKDDEAWDHAHQFVADH